MSPLMPTPDGGMEDGCPKLTREFKVSRLQMVAPEYFPYSDAELRAVYNGWYSDELSIEGLSPRELRLLMTLDATNKHLGERAERAERARDTLVSAVQADTDRGMNAGLCAENIQLHAQLDAARSRAEVDRMRLVACDVVAMSDTPESAAKAREIAAKYRSAALDAVIRRVDECIALRSENGRLRDALERIRAHEKRDHPGPAETKVETIARAALARPGARVPSPPLSERAQMLRKPPHPVDLLGGDEVPEPVPDREALAPPAGGEEVDNYAEWHRDYHENGVPGKRGVFYTDGPIPLADCGDSVKWSHADGITRTCREVYQSEAAKEKVPVGQGLVDVPEQPGQPTGTDPLSEAARGLAEAVDALRWTPECECPTGSGPATGPHSVSAVLIINHRPGCLTLALAAFREAKGRGDKS